MRWEDERYVRWYTRNTPEWNALSWRARGLFGLILRELDRAGILALGKLGLRAVAVQVRAEWPDIEGPLGELLADGMLVQRDDKLVAPNFIEAQECHQSDKARQRASRERARDGASRNVTTATRAVTECRATVTAGHGASHAVTPSLAVPSLAVPSLLPPSASPKEKSPRSKPKTPIPRDWQPPTDEHAHSWHQEVRRHALAQAEVDTALSEFKLHHEARGELRADWVASWRLWLSRVRRYGASGQRNGKPMQQAALPGEHDWSVAARAKAVIV